MRVFIYICSISDGYNTVPKAAECLTRRRRLVKMWTPLAQSVTRLAWLVNTLFLIQIDLIKTRRLHPVFCQIGLHQTIQRSRRICLRQVILYFHLYVFIFRREYSVQKAPKFVPRRRRLGSNVDAFCTECYQPAFAWLVKTMFNKIFFLRRLWLWYRR